MKADEIHDLESFEKWVAAGPSVVNDTAFVQIALRAALRTFPLFASQIGANWMAEWNVSSLPTLRYALTIGVSQHFGREEFAVALVKAQIAVNRDATSASNANDFGPSLGDTTAASTFINGFSSASYVQSAPKVASNADVAAELVSGSTGQIWSTVARDAMRAEVGTALLYAPLWVSDRPDWFTAADTRARQIWSLEPETWDFWIRWWDGVLSGNQLDWDLQKAVALEIPEAAWSDPKTVAAHIREIEARFRVKDSENKAIDYLHAAMADYSFDSIDRVMRLVPFKEDIEHIRTPEKIAAFLADTDVLRDDLELFLRALAAEGGMQWANYIKTYFQAILEELAQARQLRHLRVGRIVNLGKKLESWSVDEGVESAFGPAIHEFREILNELRKVANRHFAATLVRFAPLRDISSSDQDNHWHLLQDMQRGIKELAEPIGDLPPLAKADVEVLLSIVDGVETLLVRHDQLPKGDARSSLRREVDYQLALASVSVALFLERSYERLGRADKIAEVVEKLIKRGMTLGNLWKVIRDLMS